MHRRLKIIDHAKTSIPLPLLGPLAELIHRSALQHLSIPERVILHTRVHRSIVRVAERVLAICIQAVVGMPFSESRRIGSAKVGNNFPNVFLGDDPTNQRREPV